MRASSGVRSSAGRASWELQALPAPEAKAQAV